MQLVYTKDKGCVLGFKPEELHIILAVLSYLLKNWVPSDAHAFNAVYRRVESDFRHKLEKDEMARRYKLCIKCCREIDTDTDKYTHHQFDSGFETYQHQACPPLKEVP